MSDKHINIVLTAMADEESDRYCASSVYAILISERISFLA